MTDQHATATRSVSSAPGTARSAAAVAKPLRVLLLNERCHRNPLAGGAETHRFEIFGRLADRGVRMELVCSGFPKASPTDEHRRVAVSRIGTRLSYYAQVPGEVRRRVAAGEVDLIVEAHNKIPFFSPLYAGRVPVLVIRHHLHGWTAFRQVSPPIAALALGLEKLIPRVYRHAPFLTISASSKRDLVARGVHEEQIDVVPCGLDHVLHRPAPAEGRAPLVISLGRLEPYKRLDLVLAAWPSALAEVPDAQLAIVGRGQEELRLRSLAAGLGLLGSVTFAGFVTGAEKVAWLQRAALLVRVSRKEGWGLSAYACGAPVVAGDVPGLADSVQDGVTGLLVRQARPAALAAAITNLLADEEARQRMSCRALAWSAYFDWEESALAVLRAAQRAVLSSRPVVRIQAPTCAGRPTTSLSVAAVGPRESS